MKKILSVLCLFVFLLGSYAFYQIFIDEPEIVPIQSSFEFNHTNPKEVMDWSEHVFVGKVIKKIGEKTDDERVPRTQYEIEVIENIKGELEKTTTVSQFAGHQLIGVNKVLFIEEGDELLKEGQTYLLAGRVDKENNWVDLITFSGKQKLSSEQEKNEKVEIMKEALKNEINPEI